MAKITVPKKQLEPPAKLPGGVYEIMCKGFKPQWTKGTDPTKSKSINLCPQLNVINNSNGEFNGKPVYDWLNQNAGWIINDFCHAFGLEMVDKGDSVDIPGEFVGPDGDPTKWTYNGPLTNATGNVELVEIDSNKGGKLTVVKRYICKVPGCTTQHSENLVRS